MELRRANESSKIDHELQTILERHMDALRRDLAAQKPAVEAELTLLQWLCERHSLSIPIAKIADSELPPSPHKLHGEDRSQLSLPPPEVIILQCPEFTDLDGAYTKRDVKFNGRPFWVSEDRILYMASDNAWSVCKGEDSMRKSLGRLLCSSVGDECDGCPHLARGWQYLNAGCWRQSGVKVYLPPPRELKFQCPSMPVFSGEYVLTQKHNGWPVWRSSRDCYIYKNSEGEWALCEGKDGVYKERAWLFSNEFALGGFPDSVRAWEDLQGNNVEASVCVTRKAIGISSTKVEERVDDASDQMNQSRCHSCTSCFTWLCRFEQKKPSDVQQSMFAPECANRDLECNRWMHSEAAPLRCDDLPACLEIYCPDKPKVCGTYTLLEDSHDGSPIWNCGSSYIYRTSSNTWAVSCDESSIDDDAGWMESAKYRHERTPDLVKQWELRDAGNVCSSSSSTCIRSVEAPPPQTLLVLCSDNLDLEGYYTIASSKLNNQPTWCDGDKIIYMTGSNFWAIGIREARTDQDCGILYSKYATSKGIHPDSVEDWGCFNGTQWLPSNAKISASLGSPPPRLTVECIDPSRLAGVYSRVGGEHNDFPFWSDGSNFLFMSSRGKRWTLCIGEANLKKNRGLIHSKRPGLGRYPNAVEVWEKMDGKKAEVRVFANEVATQDNGDRGRHASSDEDQNSLDAPEIVSDSIPPDVALGSAEQVVPEFLKLECPEKVDLDGYYWLLDTSCNGRPCWTDGQNYVYMTAAKAWGVCIDAESMEKNVGWLFSKSGVADWQCPQDMVSWKYYTGDEWKPSKTSVAASPTPYLQLNCLEKRDAEGVYFLQIPSFRGRPVWRNGSHYLYMNTNKSWAFSTGPANVHSNDYWLHSESEADVEYPDVANKWRYCDWRRLNTCSAQVKIVRKPPPKVLHIRCSEVSEITGAYKLLEREHNGRPMWGREDRRIYMTKSASWAVGIGEESIDADKGWLYSLFTGADKRFPDAVEEWYYYAEENWLPSIACLMVGPPRRLCVECPAELELRGFYELLEWERHGYPIWRGGRNYICMSARGAWTIETEPLIASNSENRGGFLQSYLEGAHRKYPCAIPEWCDRHGVLIQARVHETNELAIYLDEKHL